jgi:predicted nucleotidyltransferase
MLFTKNQIKILKLFTANIAKRFSIRRVAKLINVDYSHVYKSIKPLIAEGFLDEDDEKYLWLNYRANQQLLAYIESLRGLDFLKRKDNSTVKLFANEILKEIDTDFFIFIIFGSAVEKEKRSDVDVLLVVDSSDKVDFTEKMAFRVAENYSEKFHIGVISFESVYEMLGKRDELNVMNETLNKHIIFYGAEAYYRMVKNARR